MTANSDPFKVGCCGIDFMIQTFATMFIVSQYGNSVRVEVYQAEKG